MQSLRLVFGITLMSTNCSTFFFGIDLGYWTGTMVAHRVSILMWKHLRAVSVVWFKHGGLRLTFQHNFCICFARIFHKDASCFLLTLGLFVLIREFWIIRLLLFYFLIQRGTLWIDGLIIFYASCWWLVEP